MAQKDSLTTTFTCKTCGEPVSVIYSWKTKEAVYNHGESYMTLGSSVPAKTYDHPVDPQVMDMPSRESGWGV